MVPGEAALDTEVVNPGIIGAARSMLAVVGVAILGFGLVSMTVSDYQSPAWEFRIPIATFCFALMLASYYSTWLEKRLRHAVWIVFVFLYAFFLARAVAAEMPPTGVVALLLIYMFPLLLLERAWEHGLLTLMVIAMTTFGYAYTTSPVMPLFTFIACLLSVGAGGAVATLARVRAEEALRSSQTRLEARVHERTAQLEAEVAERRAAEADALRASRAKSSFLANMSHELRTPLNAITGYTELVQDELVDLDQPELIADLDRVRDSAAHLLRMVANVLDLSRIEAGELTVVAELVDLPSKMDELVRLVEPERVRSGCTLLVDVTPNLNVDTDPARLAQITLNLITNALKFTKEGTVTLSVKLDSEQLVLSVRDTGVGIATDDIDRVFQTFVQVDGSSTRRNDGSGLGLALSKDLAQRLGGTLTARSTLGEGSTFTLRLPYAFLADDNG